MFRQVILSLNNVGKVTQLTGCMANQVRTTVVLRREYPLRLVKKEGGIMPCKGWHFVYKMEDNENKRPRPDITCILTDYVEGIGRRGDMVKVKRALFRNHLLPGGFALYATPENIETFKKEIAALDGPRQSTYGRMTLTFLKDFELDVPMSGDNEWEVTRQHVQIAFRRKGVEVPAEAITLPEEPIRVAKDFEVDVMVNSLDVVQVKCTVVQLYNNGDVRLPDTALESIIKEYAVDDD